MSATDITVFFNAIYSSGISIFIFMKYRKILLSIAAALVSFAAWSKKVDVIRVLSSTDSPIYIRFDENPSIKYSEGEIVLSTRSSVLTFDFNSNPGIVFLQMDEKDLTSIKTITIDEIISNDKIQIFNLLGQSIDKVNLAPGNYIVKTPSQTFKFQKK